MYDLMLHWITMKYAVSRKKMSSVGEYEYALVFLTLPISIFNQTTLGIVSEKGGNARISFFFIYNMPLLLKHKYSYTLYVEIVSILWIE